MQLDTNERVRALEAVLATTEQRVQQLEAEREPAAARAGRRNFLKLAAAGAAAGAGVAALQSSPVAASTGGALTIGQSNSPTSVADLTTLVSPSATTLARSLLWSKNYTQSYTLTDLLWRASIVGSTTDADASAGFRLGVVGEVAAFSDTDKKGVGVLGIANRPETGFVPDVLLLPTEPVGVLGYAAAQGASGSGTAVKGFVNDGSNTIGVHGVTVNTVGVQAEATASGGVGLNATAPTNAIAARVAGRFRQVTAASPGAPSFSIANAGEQWRDSNGDMWLCTLSGSPGTWRKVVAQHPNFPSAGGSVNFLQNPIRILDTRPSSVAPQNNGLSPLTANTDLVVDIATINVGGVLVPAGATGIIGNLTAVPLTGNGFMTLWAENVAQPGTSNLNFRAGVNIANSFVCALSPAGKVRVRSSVATNVLLDVVGFLF